MRALVLVKHGLQGHWMEEERKWGTLQDGEADRLFMLEIRTETTLQGMQNNLRKLNCWRRAERGVLVMSYNTLESIKRPSEGDESRDHNRTR